MSDPTIRVVLDASAILAYTHGSLAVGEVISEVSDEMDCAVGLPYLSLVEAAWAVADRDRLNYLVRRLPTRILAADPAEWSRLVDSHRIVGRLEASCAAVIAVAEDCDVLTACPGLYAGLEDGGPVIPF